MASSYKFLYQKKLNLILSFSIILIFSIMAQLTIQYFSYTKIVAKESLHFKQELQEELNKKNNSLEILATLLNRAEEHTIDTVLNTFSLDENKLGLIAVGKAVKIPRSNIDKLKKSMIKKGYESFREKPFKNQPKNHGDYPIIIRDVFPFTPRIQMLLGQDITTIPDFYQLTNNLITSNQPQPFLFIDSNKPLLLLFYASPHFINKAELSSNYFFYIIDVSSVIKALANHALSTPLTQISLLLRDNRTFNLIPDTDNNTGFNLKNTITLDVNGIPASLTLTSPITKQSFSLTVALGWGGFISLLLFFIFIILLFLNKYLAEIRVQYHRQTELLRNSHDAIIITAKNGKINNWNPKATQLFGYSSAEVQDQYIQEIIFTPNNLNSLNNLGDDTNNSLANFQQLDFKNHWFTKLLNKNQNLIDCKVSISTLKLSDHDETVFYIEDISEQKRNEQAIHQLAYYDALTGLENRSYFTEKVEKILSQEGGFEAALLFIDLDGFKRINDSLGHTTGDELLKVIAQRFTHSTRTNQDNTYLCRFGGDEFIFYLHDISFEDTAKLCLRILQQVEQVIHLNNNEVQITASIGVACIPKHGKNLNDLLRFADTAMYAAKKDGKNTYAVYDSKMEETLSRGLLIEKHLRKAIDNNEFTLHYQPQINIKTHQITGVEALIRWNNKTLGFVPPDQFIAIAEDSAQILAIGNWVAQTAIAQLKTWQNTIYKNTRIAINVSSQQLTKINFISDINLWLTEAGVAPHLLEIELTERSIMSNANTNIALFNNIRQQGMSLAVDDFGTGYSSLSYLKRFPLNILKVDKSFVDGLPEDADDVSISATIINLAHSLNMFVVAEGVENKEQLSLLKDLGCDMIQGYYFSRPLPIKKLEEWIKEYNLNLASARTHRAQALD